MPQENWHFYWKTDMWCQVCDLWSSQCIWEAQRIVTTSSVCSVETHSGEGQKCCSKLINLRISKTNLLTKAKNIVPRRDGWHFPPSIPKSSCCRCPKRCLLLPQKKGHKPRVRLTQSWLLVYWPLANSSFPCPEGWRRETILLHRQSWQTILGD